MSHSKALKSCVLMAVASVLLAGPVAADRDPWPYLPVDDIGAVDWRTAHPEWDGRGVVIAILDTGVDGFAPGMLATSAGGTKLIEARDFTPEGLWDVAEATFEDGVLLTEDGLRLSGFADLAVAPDTADLARRPVYIGVIEEDGYKNSVEDVNDDGDQGDRFGFLVYEADRAAVESALGLGAGLEMLAGLNDTAAATVERERASSKVWLVVVDTDADGSLADETILRDYHVNHDLFTMTSPNAPDGRTMMAWSVNVTTEADRMGAPQAPTVEFHHDSGAHGSHCAGIAAGFEVSGQDGLHGAAPGAWVISCKLGDNRLSGGATRTESMKKAAEFAAEFGERYGLPVVVNMSFGINSVEEDEDAIGGFLDGLLAEYPTFTFCTSNGNEGPGLSTSGIPSTSQSVISSGAYLSRASGADLYNADLPVNTLFAFSSRGGESQKPDVVAPGSALSTVPGHVDGSARFNGTSMASPQTAGAVACLISAALAEDRPFHWGMIKRSLIAGAARVPGLELFEQGGGLVNIEGSWNVLRKLSDSESARQILDWRVSAPCPFQADGRAPAAYWRTPGGTPFSPEKVSFEIRPVFHPDLTADERDVFFRSFTLKSEAPWLRVLSTKRYVRGDMAMQVDVTYDQKKMAEPGVYSARVIGSLDGGDLSGLAAREFSLWNTVVMSEPAGDDHSYVFDGKGLQASTTHRHFVEVPAGATAMRCRLEVSSDVGAKDGAGCYLEICDPEGAVKGGWHGYARPETRPITDTVIHPPVLRPGVWEMNIAAAIGNLADTDYRLTVSFDAYDVRPCEITDLPRKGAGKAASTELEITRAYRGVLRGGATASIDGFRRERDIEVEDTDTWTHRFTLDGETPRAEFHLTMDEATANLFTDCAVNILDAQGNAVRGTGFGGLVCDLSLGLPHGQDSATYTLQVVGGFALAADKGEWGFGIEELYRLAAPVRGTVSPAHGRNLVFHSGVPATVTVEFDEAWPTAPDGLHAAGRVVFRDDNLDDRRAGDDAGRPVIEVPIRLTD